jgi:heme-degrading monooxygenase HmoA
VSITVVVKLKVEDHAKFEASFANRTSARVAAGLEVKAYRDMDDPTSVVVIGTAASKEAFFAFMTSPEQQEAMKNATIQGHPDVTFLEG